MDYNRGVIAHPKSDSDYILTSRRDRSAMHANHFPHPGRRIAVVGVTGSGKSTLAASLAEILGLAHIELDALRFGPNWSEPPDEVFRARVAEALQAPGWVTDGNYSRVRDIIWKQAETVVWLDYPFLLCFFRLLRRSFRRVVFRIELWGGNRETLRGVLFEKDALFPWLFKTFPRRRREYPLLLSQPEYAHLRLIRLRNPRQTAAWLASLGAPGHEFDSQVIPD